VVQFSCRRLGEGDLAGFRRMNALFGEVFDEGGTYHAAPPDDAYARRWLAQPHHFALVAEVNGILAGALTAYELMKFEQARSEIYIYDLAVAQAFRRRGVASGLIALLRRIAREGAAWVIYVQADRGDDPAIALYAGLGLPEDVLHFDIAP
jgi:aminoglycoside 3-N-acetyltransferase I